MVKQTRQKQRNLQSVFNVWADGSFEKKAQYVGTGCLITDGHDHVLKQSMRSFDRTSQSSSTIAEILSCSEALSHLPDGCKIKLHSDCQFVIDAINGIKYSHTKPAINLALKGLFNQVSRQESVKAILTPEKTSYFLKLAHKLSVAARKYQV